jgi:LysR family carnitine catabolism transcriptional activator
MRTAHDLPDFSTKHLRALVALAQYGSFIAGAAYLGMSQPGLTRLVQQAEQMLGVPLFSRANRSVAPTSAGRVFVTVAERLLNELQQQVRQVRALDEELHGQLTISSLMSLCHRVVPAALTLFGREHSKIHIRIREGLNADVQEDLRRGVADFGIANVNPSDRNLTVDTSVQETCSVVLPPGHSRAGRACISLSELAGESMISMPPEAGLRRVIDQAALREGVVLNHAIIISQYQSLFGFVANGLGVSIVPASALSEAARQSVLVRALRPAILREIGILYPSDRPLSPASTRFLELFRPMFLAATGGGK